MAQDIVTKNTLFGLTTWTCEPGRMYQYHTWSPAKISSIFVSRVSWCEVSIANCCRSFYSVAGPTE